MSEIVYWMLRDKKTGGFYCKVKDTLHLQGETTTPRIPPAVFYEAYALLLAAHIEGAEAVRFPPLPLEPVEPVFPLYSQRDPRWGDDTMGDTAMKMKDWGCLVTCIAMMLVHATGDESITPKLVNQRLTREGGYAPGNANLYWARVGELWPTIDFTGTLKYDYPARADTVLINGRLDRGEYGIIQVDFDPQDSDVDQHWVLVVGRDEDNSYFIHDPWTGKKHDMPPAYAKTGWHPGDTIFRIAFYKKIE